MKISDEYSIEAIDYDNVTLSQAYIDKKGRPATKIIGYFPSIGKALNYLIIHSINGTGLKDVNEVVKKIMTLKEMINLLDTDGLQKALNENRDLKKRISELESKGDKKNGSK